MTSFQVGEERLAWVGECHSPEGEEFFLPDSVTRFFHSELHYDRVDFWCWVKRSPTDIPHDLDILTGEFHNEREIGVMGFFRASFEDFFSDFFLHHDDHGFRTLLEIIEKAEEDRTRDVVGDIRDDRVVVIWGSELQDILMVERYRSRLHYALVFSYYLRQSICLHESLIEDLYHISIELYEVESRWVMREDIFSECSVSRSDFDDMLPGELQRTGDVTECFLVDEEVLSEGFFGLDGFHEEYLLFSFHD